MTEPLRDDPRLASWIESLLATPGMTAVTTQAEAWRLHVNEVLFALPLIDAGPVVDVGSGGGSPGIPIAAGHPELSVDLLEATNKKCEFLRRVTAGFANVGVVCGRAEELGRRHGRDAYAAAVARALAPPAVAAEWCLPLVRPGGRLLLFAGADDTDLEAVAASARRWAAGDGPRARRNEPALAGFPQARCDAGSVSEAAGGRPQAATYGAVVKAPTRCRRSRHVQFRY